MSHRQILRTMLFQGVSAFAVRAMGSQARALQCC
jgi:hypothetical protein